MTFKFCPDCGARLIEGKRFCHNCGTPLPPSADSTETAAPQNRVAVLQDSAVNGDPSADGPSDEDGSSASPDGYPYGITFDGEQYVYRDEHFAHARDYRYDRLEDAIEYARIRTLINSGTEADASVSSLTSPVAPRTATAPTLPSHPVEDSGARKWAIAGLVLGFAGLLLHPAGAFPIAAVVVSIVALAKAKGYWVNYLMAGIGLLLGAVYTLLYMQYFGHLG